MGQPLVLHLTQQLLELIALQVQRIQQLLELIALQVQLTQQLLELIALQVQLTQQLLELQLQGILVQQPLEPLEPYLLVQLAQQPPVLPLQESLAPQTLDKRAQQQHCYQPLMDAQQGAQLVAPHPTHACADQDQLQQLWTTKQHIQNQQSLHNILLSFKPDDLRCVQSLCFDSVEIYSGG